MKADAPAPTTGVIPRFSSLTKRAASFPGWCYPAASGLVTIVAVFLRLGLWQYRLSVPFVYAGDALYETVLVKALSEGPWNYFIPQLGAPFGGMATVDFPLGCSLDFAIIKILSFVLRNPFFLINAYWLLSLGLAAAFATLLFRFLGINRLWSAAFGVVYGILPWVFFRNISHLNLVHFITPVAAYLGLSLARVSRTNQAGSSLFVRNRLLFHIALCCAIGFAYVYWAFFACMMVAIGALIGFGRTKSKPVIATAALYIAVIGISALADISPSLWYWHRHGPNLMLAYKSPAEADLYGLKIRQLIAPIPGHPLPILRRAQREIVAAAFPYDQLESRMSGLGTIGSIGLLILFVAAIVPMRNRLAGNSRIRILAGFAVASILIAEVGGMGSLFNVFVMPEFRCYTRISTFVSLFSLAAVALIVDRLTGRIHPYGKVAMAGAMIVAGAYDQVPMALFADQRNVTQQFYQDRQFIRKLEAALPAGSMIFQLPNTGFPLDSQRGKMAIYDNARGYLHSKTLRWSWAMEGRNYDWPRKTDKLPTPEFLETVAFAGFRGILLDRWGYADTHREQEITEQLGNATNVDARQRWAFFDLESFRVQLAKGRSAAELQQREQLARDPINLVVYNVGERIDFGRNGNSEPFKESGWSVPDEEGTWTNGKSAVLIFGRLPRAKALSLTIQATGLVYGPELPVQPVELYANGTKVADWQVAGRTNYTAAIPPNVVSQQGDLVLEFRIPRAASPLSFEMSLDARMLGLRVFSLVFDSVPPS